jgi:hypothetical protein
MIKFLGRGKQCESVDECNHVTSRDIGLIDRHSMNPSLRYLRTHVWIPSELAVVPCVSLTACMRFTGMPLLVSPPDHQPYRDETIMPHR